MTNLSPRRTGLIRLAICCFVVGSSTLACSPGIFSGPSNGIFDILINLPPGGRSCNPPPSCPGAGAKCERCVIYAIKLQTLQFTGSGFISLGSGIDITKTAQWSSSNAAVATVNTSGLLTLNGLGVVVIHMAYQGFDDHLTVTITDQ